MSQGQIRGPNKVRLAHDNIKLLHGLFWHWLSTTYFKSWSHVVGCFTVISLIEAPGRGLDKSLGGGYIRFREPGVALTNMKY